MIGWGLVHYTRKLRRFIANPEWWVDDYLQDMYNEKCNQAHLRDMPLDYRSSLHFSQYELGNTIFAKMSRVEQEAVLFNILYRTYQERDDLIRLREAERHLHKVRAERVERASERMRNRLEVHRQMSGVIVEMKAIDPKTGFEMNYSVGPREDVEKARSRIVQRFPEQVFSQVTDDEQLLREL